MTFWEWLENKSDEELKEDYRKALKEISEFFKGIDDAKDYCSSDSSVDLADSLISHLIEEYRAVEIPEEVTGNLKQI